MFSCPYPRMAFTLLTLRLINCTGQKLLTKLLDAADKSTWLERGRCNPVASNRLAPQAQAAAYEAAARQALVLRDTAILAVPENPAIAFRDWARRLFQLRPEIRSGAG